jgi:hypothetical protein
LIDRRDQLPAQFGFLDEIAIAEEAAENCGFLWSVMTADQDNLGLGSVLAYFAGCLDAAHLRHDNVEHGDIRMDFLD